MSADAIYYDVIIVGAGPAGLSCAIHLQQLAHKKNSSVKIAVLEKGNAVGAHILSGAVMDPSSLNTLLPDWTERAPTYFSPVHQDRLYHLTKKRAFRLLVPRLLRNKGHWIISLSALCRSLAEQATDMHIDIFTSTAVADLIYNTDQSAIIGVRTQDVGRAASGQPGPQFQRGIALYAKQVVLAEGARGSLAKKASAHFYPASTRRPQSYALGLKEVWEVAPERNAPGTVIHTSGWPFNQHATGGGFLYHMKEGLVSVGLIVNLNYKNPYLNPFLELQRFKHHPFIASQLKGGRCLEYGARAINKSGLQGWRPMTFPGGLLIGCNAGLLDSGRIKGIDHAITSGMIAATSISQALTNYQDQPITLTDYEPAIKQSKIYSALYKSRNIGAAHHLKHGHSIMLALEYYAWRGRAPWTLPYRHSSHLKPAAACRPIHYTAPDQTRSFDLTTQLARSGTRHKEQQPSHLVLKDPSLALTYHWPMFKGLEERYCPGGVYRFDHIDHVMQLSIQSIQCLHCKACDIMDPQQNITWQVPEGGDGPCYRLM